MFLSRVDVSAVVRVEAIALGGEPKRTAGMTPSKTLRGEGAEKKMEIENNGNDGLSSGGAPIRTPCDSYRMARDGSDRRTYIRCKEVRDEHHGELQSDGGPH